MVGHVFPQSGRSNASLPTRGVLHDEKYFSNPDRFVPERHLKEGNTTGETALLEVSDYLFGFARRSASSLHHILQ